MVPNTVKDEPFRPNVEKVLSNARGVRLYRPVALFTPSVRRRTVRLY